MPNGKEIKVRSNNENARLNDSEMRKLNMRASSNANQISLPKLKTGRHKPSHTAMSPNALGYDAFF